MPLPSLEAIRDDFAVLDEWEDRYRYIIELGRRLPALDERLRVPANKVRGCASQVWIWPAVTDGPDGPVLFYAGDSDALIVKGLIAIAFVLYSGKPARAILGIDAGPPLSELGLFAHLTPQRSNGFASMIARIKADAAKALAGAKLNA